MSDIKLLKLILKISNEIFLKDKDLSTQANGLLNQFKGDPSYLNKFKLSNIELFRNLVIFIIKDIYIIFLSIKFSLKSIFKAKSENKLKKKIKVIMFSQIISPNQNKKNDIYFGSIGKVLKKKKIKYKKVFINNLGLRSVNKKFYDLTNSENFVINININLFILFEIYVIIFKKFLKYFFLSLSLNETKEKRKILRTLSFEFLNPNTINNLILEKKFEKFLSNFEIKNLIATLEGFSWEKMLFYAINKISPNTRIVGYQFATLTNNQVISSRLINKNFKPDVIWTSGKINKIKLSKDYKNVKIIGTDRVSKLKITNIKKKNINFLVLPEGISYEIDVMLKFTLECAKNFPQHNFIWRFHPSINKHNVLKKIIKGPVPKNIIISDKKLLKDISNCSLFFYRGSTTAITALQSGLYPIYINLNKKISIDPLFEFVSWKKVLNSQSEFNYFVKNEMKKTLYLDFKKKQGQEFSKNYFMNLNSKSIHKSLSI